MKRYERKLNESRDYKQLAINNISSYIDELLMDKEIDYEISDIGSAVAFIIIESTRIADLNGKEFRNFINAVKNTL